MESSPRALPPRYDPLAPEVLDDPYPVYRRLRRAGPLSRGGPGQWVATRYEDVARLLKDRRLGSEIPVAGRTFALGSGSASSFYERIVLYRDPPTHGPLRAALGRGLRPPVLKALAERLPTIVDELLRPAMDGETLDVVDDLAVPLSLRVVCEIIGFPKSDAEEIRPRALGLSKAFGTRINEADRADANAAVDWLREYAGEMLEHRRLAPRDDLLSQLAALQGAPTLEERIDNVAFLLFAGFETTASLLANGAAALLAHPEELARLRSRPELMASAVEELLRYDPPIQGVARTVCEPLEIAGRRLREGRVLVLLVGSANRDENRFADPDRLDLGRDPNPHLSFGGGAHYCLGASLARLEVGATLSRLTTRVMEMSPAGPAVRRLDTRLRCYESLPVTLRPF